VRDWFQHSGKHSDGDSPDLVLVATAAEECMYIVRNPNSIAASVRLQPVIFAMDVKLAVLLGFSVPGCLLPKLNG
jgi:hypothetical protein